MIRNIYIYTRLNDFGGSNENHVIKYVCFVILLKIKWKGFIFWMCICTI